MFGAEHQQNLTTLFERKCIFISDEEIWPTKNWTFKYHCPCHGPCPPHEPSSTPEPSLTSPPPALRASTAAAVLVFPFIARDDRSPDRSPSGPPHFWSPHRGFQIGNQGCARGEGIRWRGLLKSVWGSRVLDVCWSRITIGIYGFVIICYRIKTWGRVPDTTKLSKNLTKINVLILSVLSIWLNEKTWKLWGMFKILKNPVFLLHLKIPVRRWVVSSSGSGVWWSAPSSALSSASLPGDYAPCLHPGISWGTATLGTRGKWESIYVWRAYFVLSKKWYSKLNFFWRKRNFISLFLKNAKYFNINHRFGKTDFDFSDSLKPILKSNDKM